MTTPILSTSTIDLQWDILFYEQGRPVHMGLYVEPAKVEDDLPVWEEIVRSFRFVEDQSQ